MSYGIDPSKITIIPHGVPNVHRVSATKVKRALGIWQTSRFISTFGLINRGKGIEYVIKAMPKILEKHPNAIYLVLGETHPGVRKHEGESYRNMLTEIISELGHRGQCPVQQPVPCAQANWCAICARLMST